jgi:hypothetical protein
MSIEEELGYLRACANYLVEAVEATKFDVFIGTPTELQRIKNALGKVREALERAEGRTPRGSSPPSAPPAVTNATSDLSSSTSGGVTPGAPETKDQP